MIKQLTSRDFTAHLNTNFNIHYGGEAPLPVVLIEVKELGGVLPGSTQPPFSLVFESHGADQYLIQKIYLLEHPVLGAVEMFIVPLGPQGDRMIYEIIVS